MPARAQSAHAGTDRFHPDCLCVPHKVRWAWPLGRPLVAHLRGEIWEVRCSLNGRCGRVLFAIAGKEMVLLHGFIKKTRATPGGELALAERRWKVWQGQQGEEDE